jgi:hypothetical protein
MKVRNDILELSNTQKAQVEIWADSENSYVIEATAPDGMEWVESGGVSLVARWFTYAPEDKKAAMDDILERMKLGLQKEE